LKVTATRYALLPGCNLSARRTIAVNFRFIVKNAQVGNFNPLVQCHPRVLTGFLVFLMAESQ
jgi:hypothetical protein